MSVPLLGMQQEVAYEDSAARLYFYVIDDFGRAAEPDAVPTITITSTTGTELVAATNTTVYAGTDTGFLKYDGQAASGAEFEVGEVVTGGTSSAAGTVVGQWKTGASGVLELVDISGTFQNNEAITGSESGVAVVNETLWQSLHYYDLDASSTSNYKQGKNYGAEFNYAIGSRSMVERMYFDVVYYPANRPFITSTQIDKEYPGLIGKCPEEWGDWSFPIKAAHRELVNKIHALGDQAAFYLKRREEMGQIELTMTRHKIAERIGESEETLDYWERQAINAWVSRGEFTYDSSQTDSEVDEGVKVINSRFTR